MTFPQENPDKEPVYDSPLIRERRRRILRETRRLIAERGLEKFSIQELCKRAEVAHRTLYNAFQSRDRVIALALRETMIDFSQHLEFETDRSTLAGFLSRKIAIHGRNLQIRNYTSAVMSIYFSERTSHDIWQAIHQIGKEGNLILLNALSAKGEIAPYIAVDETTSQLVNVEYSVINDWCRGRIADGEFVRAVLQTILIYLIGVTQPGETQAELKAVLTVMSRTGELPAYPKPRLAAPGAPP